jgi:MscS family membrane protein
VTPDEGLDRNRRRLRRWTYRLELLFAVFMLVVPIAHSSAQFSTAAAPAAKSEPAKPVDPLGRETPLSSMMGFLKCIDHQDYENAARYLQPGSNVNVPLMLRAREAQGLRGRFRGTLAMLSDNPEGTLEPGLPPGQVRAGVLSAGGMTVDVILVRVDDPTFGKIWLISKETLAGIPELYARIDREAPTLADRIIPAALADRRVLQMSLGQWLGWLLSIPVSLLLAWSLAFVVAAPLRIRNKLRGLPFTPVLETRLGMPLKCIVAILLHSFFVYLLQPPLLFRIYYFRLMATLLVGCSVWLISTITDRGFERAVIQTRNQHKGGESILIVMQRLTRIVLMVIALLVALAVFGLNVTTTLAGLGIGGLAIALGAQRTLENVIGGLSLLMDKAVLVGDFCQIGDQRGTVEDIGLRSLKLRTVDQTLLVVPNGSLAQMQFGNLTGRRKLLINQTFALRIETEVEQLRFILDSVQTMLDHHPAIESGTSRVRVTNFAGAAFQLELFAYVTTGDWAQFTAIRQDVLLKIAAIVEGSGTKFAAPTQLAYLSTDSGVDVDKTNDVLRRVTELRASDMFRFPGEARSGAEQSSSHSAK